MREIPACRKSVHDSDKVQAHEATAENCSFQPFLVLLMIGQLVQHIVLHFFVHRPLLQIVLHFVIYIMYIIQSWAVRK
jgi:hypothetical protein